MELAGRWLFQEIFDEQRTLTDPYVALVMCDLRIKELQTFVLKNSEEE